MEMVKMHKQCDKAVSGDENGTLLFTQWVGVCVKKVGNVLTVGGCEPSPALRWCRRVQSAC